MIRRVLCLLLALLGLLALTGCAIGVAQGSEGDAAADAAAAAITELSQLNGGRLGIMTGTTFDDLADQFFTDTRKSYYNAYTDMVEAIRQGKLDGFLMDEPTAAVLCARAGGVHYLPEMLTHENYAIAFPKTDDGAALRDELNDYLAQLREDGTLEEILDVWTGADESVKTLDDPESLPATNGRTLEYATSGSRSRCPSCRTARRWAMRWTS